MCNIWFRPWPGVCAADQTHFSAFASCFPGGSVTGAPKIRAMEIIDELEPVSRGPYTGAIGYLGFNRESQLNIAIRTAVCQPGAIHFQVGAGIVADSVAEAEYDETMAKAGGYFAALRDRASRKIPTHPRHDRFSQWQIRSRKPRRGFRFDRGFLYGDALFEGMLITRRAGRFAGMNTWNACNAAWIFES